MEWHGIQDNLEKKINKSNFQNFEHFPTDCKMGYLHWIHTLIFSDFPVFYFVLETTYVRKTVKPHQYLLHKFTLLTHCISITDTVHK